MLTEKTITGAQNLLKECGYDALSKELTNDNFIRSYEFAIRLEGRPKFKVLLAKALEVAKKEIEK